MAEADIGPNRPIVTRAQARELGLQFYFTGTPCKRGHIAQRWTSKAECVECKRGRREDPAVARARASAWYYANKVRAADWGAAYFQKNKQAIYETRKGWSDRNPGKNAEYQRAWNANNPEGRKRLNEAWREKNPDAVASHWRNRRAREARAEGSHTSGEIKSLFAKQKGKCANCHKSLAKGFHADHIVPLSKGGSNWITNIQLLCARCNCRKWNKDPETWAKENGRLV